MNFREFKKKFQIKEVEEISFSPPAHPVVSVLVQTYQQKDFIRECLESILIQETPFEFEILVGDDGSRDGTREICLEYAKKYPGKIRLFLHHRENQIKVLGEDTSNFNAFYNFYSARGEFIAFCEGDDKWSDPLKLKKQVEFLNREPQLSFTFHSFKTIDERSKKVSFRPEIKQVKHDLKEKELIEGLFHPLLLTVCFKRKKINLPEEIFGVLNVDTFLLILFGELGEAKYQSNITPSLYRISSSGIWSKETRNKKLLSKIQTYQSIVDYFKRTNNYFYSKYFHSRLKLHYKMLMVSHLRNKNLLLAGRSFLNSLK